MKIQYLGTAAAEAIPGIFCDCDVCRKAREKGGRNIQTRSQALIDGKILIDFPGDTYMHAINNNINLSKIKTCIVTHNHFDHFYPFEIWSRSPGIAYNVDAPLCFYGTTPTYCMAMAEILKFALDEAGRVKAQRIKPFEPFEVEGYKITPLKADHDPKCEPVFYMIEKDSKAILYAHDTGIFPEESQEYLKKCGVKFDLVSLDCTNVLLPFGENHMGLEADKKVRKMLLEWGAADENTIFVVNHFSHNGGLIHDDFVPVAEKDGFIVSYDGMTVEF